MMKLLLYIFLIPFLFASCSDNKAAKAPAPVKAPPVVFRNTDDPFSSREESRRQVIEEIKAEESKGENRGFSESELKRFIYGNYDEKPSEMSSEDEQEIRALVSKKLHGNHVINRLYLLEGNAVIVKSKTSGSDSYSYQDFQIRKLKGHWVISDSDSGSMIICSFPASQVKDDWWEFLKFW